MKTILVQVSDWPWTMKATHLACAMARNAHCGITLLQLHYVTNVGLLGSGVGVHLPSRRAQRNLNECIMIAEDYSVALTLQPMQYTSLPCALVQAAEYVNASALFAHLPESILPGWQRYQVWRLRFQLAARDCQLYSLDQREQPADTESVPSLRVKTIGKI